MRSVTRTSYGVFSRARRDCARLFQALWHAAVRRRTGPASVLL